MHMHNSTLFLVVVGRHAFTLRLRWVHSWPLRSCQPSFHGSTWTTQILGGGQGEGLMQRGCDRPEKDNLQLYSNFPVLLISVFELTWLKIAYGRPLEACNLLFCLQRKLKLGKNICQSCEGNHKNVDNFSNISKVGKQEISAKVSYMNQSWAWGVNQICGRKKNIINLMRNQNELALSTVKSI